MPTFTGSFQLEGDPTPLPATISVEDGRLRMNSRSHLIGEWPVSEVDLTETEEAVIMLVEGEKVRLELRDRSGFMSATGVFRPPPKSRVGKRDRKDKKQERSAGASPIEPARPSAEEAPPREHRSIGERMRSLVDEVRPDLDDVSSVVRGFKGGPPLWITLALLVVAVIFVPTAVIVTLTIIGSIATLLATFAYLDDSLRVRFPNRLPPMVVLAAGLGTLALAVLVAIVR